MRLTDLSAGLVRGTPAFVAVAAVAAWFLPEAFVGIRGGTAKAVLGFIMLTMGMTLTVADFRAIAARPWEIALGAIGQFTVMPLVAFALALALPAEYRGVGVGLVLVGCCPGGVSSNLMSFLCKGDVAFSVGMTTVSTLLAPLLTPVLTKVLVGRLGLNGEVSVDVMRMFADLLAVTLLPVAVGFALNGLFGRRAGFVRAKAHMPALAVVALGAIVAGVMAGYRLGSQGVAELSVFAILAVVFCHNALGYALGYGLGVVARFTPPKRRTVSIEIGMQNAGLGTQLARNLSENVQTPAAVAAAIACVWHSISGALLAGLFNVLGRARRAHVAVLLVAGVALAAEATPRLSVISEVRRPPRPRSLSGITYVGGERYYAVADEGGGVEGGLYPLTIRFDDSGRRLKSMSICDVQDRVKLHGTTDLEGCAYARKTKTVWAVDEANGGICEYDPTSGRLLARVAMPEVLWRKKRPNYGLESLTMSENALTMWTANEEALTVDGALSSPTNGTTVRLVRFDRPSVKEPFKLTRMVAYETDRWTNRETFGPACRHGVSDLIVLSDGRLLVLERDLSSILPGNKIGASFTNTIYLVDPTTGTDVKDFPALKDAVYEPVKKTQLLEMRRQLANNEGFCLGPKLANGDRMIIMVADAGDGYTSLKLTTMILSGLEDGEKAKEVGP